MSHPNQSMHGLRVLFLLFFCSGFSGLVYQVVWLRMAFAKFGIVTPVLSVVISVFMLGLGVGSLLAGRWAKPLAARTGLSPATLYGLAELVIGLGALTVPALFTVGEQALLSAGGSGSSWYLFLSALMIAGAILPWCVAMGTTYPLMMAYVRARNSAEHESFSYLYLANVVGAMFGTLASALVLIELLGFARTSQVAAAVNGLIAVISFMLPRPVAMNGPADVARAAAAPRGTPGNDRWRLAVLFVTGFCSLAMEVMWTRTFTVILSTTIYAFAGILATYLLATWLGSALYRARLRRPEAPSDRVVLLVAIGGAMLPAILSDPLWSLLASMLLGVPREPAAAFLALASLVPFCATLGYLTPKLIDDATRGEPNAAGRYYAMNILGSILGPLVAGYVLAPLMDSRYALIALTLPMAILVFWRADQQEMSRIARRRIVVLVSVVLAVAAGRARGMEDYMVGERPSRLLRDHVATVVAFGTGMEKRLLVNGVGITSLTPITKVMSHLPLAVHGHARDGLVICLGMGTSVRSMATWGMNVTAVELVPSVPAMLPFFHKDADRLLANPNVRIIVDDGRRYLQRTEQMFDVIVIDPPPPAEAAGSGLLYSTGFYDVLKRRLRPDGILQQWIPGAVEPAIVTAAAQSLRMSFPHVRVYRSIEDWGFHFLASMQPLPEPSAGELLARLPPAARSDLIEWGPKATAEAMMDAVVAGRMPIGSLAPEGKTWPAISDDRPFNEYYLLRRHILGAPG